jgi:hypothetical protein
MLLEKLPGELRNEIIRLAIVSEDYNIKPSTCRSSIHALLYAFDNSQQRRCGNAGVPPESLDSSSSTKAPMPYCMPLIMPQDLDAEMLAFLRSH